MPTCRFCQDYSREPQVHYSTRHYAHFECFLDHKSLSDLTPWKINQFPYKILKARGLLDEAKRLTTEALVLPVDQLPPDHEKWTLETGNTFSNRWVRA